MAQQLGALAALAEEGQGSIPMTHGRWFAMAYNSSSRRYNVLLYPPREPTHTHVAYVNRKIHTHINKK